MIQVGEKFSLISISRACVVDDPPVRLDLPHGYFSTVSLPGKIDPHWREWLGSIRAEEWERADLYFGYKMKSNTLEVLDEENKSLNLRSLAFYWALFLTDYVRISSKPINMTGAMLETGINVRSLGSMVQPYFVQGTPLLSSRIDCNRLQKAAELANSIVKLYSDNAYRRFKRIMQAFSLGIQELHADIRLHQFVRCIEGFILPEIGNTRNQFKSRTELFIGNGKHSDMEDLFDLRSQAEHLHDTLDYMRKHNKGLPELFQRAFEAEGLARYCISRFLEKPDIWEHFKTDKNLDNFWRSTVEFRLDLWGSAMDFEALSRRFESSMVQGEDALQE